MDGIRLASGLGPYTLQESPGSMSAGEGGEADGGDGCLWVVAPGPDKHLAPVLRQACRFDPNWILHALIGLC